VASGEILVLYMPMTFCELRPIYPTCIMGTILLTLSYTKSPDTSLMGQVSISAVSSSWHATVHVGHHFNPCHEVRTCHKTFSDTILRMCHDFMTHVLHKVGCGRLKRVFFLSFSCFFNLYARGGSRISSFHPSVDLYDVFFSEFMMYHWSISTMIYQYFVYFSNF